MVHSCHKDLSETELLAAISAALDGVGIPSVLWGSFLMNVWGVPMLVYVSEWLQ